MFESAEGYGVRTGTRRTLARSSPSTSVALSPLFGSGAKRSRYHTRLLRTIVQKLVSMFMGGCPDKRAWLLLLSQHLLRRDCRV